MAELKFESVVQLSYGTGDAVFKAAGQPVKVELTEAEGAEIKAIAFRAFERVRQSLADAILTAQPALLCPPPDAEYEYAEMEPVDNVPF